MQSDDALLGAWRDGDDAAGSELLARNFSVLYRFFANKVGDDAEDLIQQTMLAAVRNRDAFRGDCSFKTFLLRIARSRLLDFLRSRGRSPVDARFELQSVRDFATRLSAVAARNEESGLVTELLQELPVEYQMALELHYWEDLRAADVAQVLEIPLGTAKTRIRRGRELLGELVASRLTDDERPGDLEHSLRSARLVPREL